MSRTLALTGIALIAASAVTGCRGGHAATLAGGPDPIAPHGRTFHTFRGYDPRPGRQHLRQPRELAPRAPAPRRRQHALRPGCRRVAGGMQCVSTRGLDRDWVFDGGGDHDENPARSLIDPED